MKTFEEVIISYLRKLAKGRPIKYDDSLKSFTIQINEWFVRTVPVYEIIEMAQE